jgi:prevent-host-death family protein
MNTLSVKEVRERLSEVLAAAESGTTTVVTRYGKPVATISPTAKRRPRLPDLTAFRRSIKIRGKSLTQTLLDMRREERD